MPQSGAHVTGLTFGVLDMSTRSGLSTEMDRWVTSVESQLTSASTAQPGTDPPNLQSTRSLMGLSLSTSSYRKMYLYIHSLDV